MSALNLWCRPCANNLIPGYSAAAGCRHTALVPWGPPEPGPPCGQLLAVLFIVTGEFPSKRPVTRSFHISFDLRLNRRLSNNKFLEQKILYLIDTINLLSSINSTFTHWRHYIFMWLATMMFTGGSQCFLKSINCCNKRFASFFIYILFLNWYSAMNQVMVK